MQCEVCGHRIEGKPYKAVIEGAKMVVCGRCVGLASTSWELPPPTSKPQLRARRAISLPPTLQVKRQPPELNQTLELVDDFSLQVRRARRKLGLSHEDLGRKIGEKVSVLRKVESGKMPPDNSLANKLEHALKIKLLIPPSEPKLPSVGPPPPREATLGDIVKLKRKKEVDTERGPS